MFMLDIIKAGLGIGFVPDFICAEALANGEVTEILPKEKRPQITLYALYPARQFVPPKLTCCVEFVERWFASKQVA